MSIQIVWNGVLLAALLLLLSFLLFKRWWVHNGNFPPSPPAWPIIGHLHLLTNIPHRTFAALSTKYGPILGLHLGSKPAVVVSNPVFARELLLTNDKIFANRPQFELCTSLLYGSGNGIIFSSYGPQWRKLRKICTLELFTAKRLQELQYVRQEEVAGLLERIREGSQEGTSAVDIGRYVAEMSGNTVSRLLQSRTLSASQQRGRSIQELVEDVEHEAAPTVGDIFPWLKWLDALRKQRMKQIHDRVDKILDSILMERKQAMETKTCPHELPKDFLDVLLSKEVGYTTSSHEALTAQEIKGIMLDILAAGIHTSVLTLEWAMAELLRNPNCLFKLQKEIDNVVGRGKQVSDSDLPKLTYLKNTVKEVFRLHPVVPLLVPRISTQICEVGNYKLPVNTLVFVNVFAIGRDPHVWEKANTFFPERFEDKDMDVKGKHYELLPFGSGRRICPGLSLGLSIVEVTLANLVTNFDWQLPQGKTIDMAEKKGIALRKATPMIAVPKPRM